MKKLIAAFLLLLPILAFSQEFQEMEDSAQKIILLMNEMTACMASIDQEKMKSFEERSSKLEAEINSLCEKGRRDEAQEKEMSFGMKIAKDPDMTAMTKCGEIMESGMNDIPLMDQAEDTHDHHVCDQIGRNDIYGPTSH